MTRAYYNEIDAYAAQWLRNLIAAGLIAPGDVDDRSIKDVRPDDLAGYTQCHFFAGIGGWSVALRLAGWPDDRPVWTGSCPCQPFSAAGAGKAANDERHLWPAWFPLIAERRPAVVFGEQVEAAIGWGWLDVVFAELEQEGYACGATVLPACGVGAPHIRQRAWFVADADGRDVRAERLQRSWQHGQRPEDGRAGRLADTPDAHRWAGERREETGARPHVERGRRSASGSADGITVANTQRAERGTDDKLNEQTTRREQAPGRISSAGASGLFMADAGCRGWGEQSAEHETGSDGPGGHADCCGGTSELGDAASPRRERVANRRRDLPAQLEAAERAGRHACAFWSDAQFIPCTDGKARPIEPGSFPLAHGIRARPSKLRAYGNAIVPQVAAQFIAAFLELRAAA